MYSRGSILLVDDEADFLDVFSEFLEEEGYSVTCSLRADDALLILDSHRGNFDLLLSDIHMPGMKGFELLNTATQRYPTLRHALITAYDVREYLYLAKTYNIGNIITKTTPFNYDEIAQMIDTIISGNIFGMQRYICGEHSETRLTRAKQIEPTINQILDVIDSAQLKRKFRQALGEILVNAFFYGACAERGDQKETWNLEAEVADSKAIVVNWASDLEKFGVSIRDTSGALKKQEVLYWLNRNSSKREDGLSAGLSDIHGKGIYITHETIDRFIINVKRNEMTEIILINYRDNKYIGHQPLWIHEI